MQPSHRIRHIHAFPLLLTFLASLALLSSISVATYASSASLKLSMKSSISTSTASALSCGVWSVVSSPNVGTHPTFLSGVTATSANDAWVVGSYVNSISEDQTLIEHWNGTSWSIVPSPNESMLNNYLVALTTISASDIWAVGYDVNSSNVDQALIEHWNGTSWSIVPSPNTGSASTSLNAVDSSSSSDVWAVGSTSSATNSKIGQTLIEHWNGTSWSIVSSPNVGSLGSGLTGVTTVSASDAWAVGTYTVSGSPYNYAQTLIEHWNGSTWSIVSSPDVGLNWNILEAVRAVSATNIWAVGYYQNSSGVDQTLIEHWNGTRWKVVSSPNAGTYNNFLLAVTRIPGTGQMWAVGSYAPTLHHVNQTLTEFYC